MNIFFPGSIGSYAHAVCINNFNEKNLIPCSSPENALDLFLEDNDPDSRVILPIENSIGGKVTDIHLLIPNFPQFFICDEYFMKIEHCLVAKKDTNFNDIKTVFSHIQALKQCSRFLDIHNFEKSESSNTAFSAEFVSKSSDNSCAAISSREAAAHFGLSIIKENIQNGVGINTTRFFSFKKRSDNIHPLDIEKKYITCIYYTVKNINSALFKSMIGFSTYNLNIIKLESFIKTPYSRLSSFYIEIEGHLHSEDVRMAIEELKLFSFDVQIIGLFNRNM